MTALHFHEVAQSGLIEAAARAIVERHRGELPHLAALTILLPNPRAAGALQRALREAAGAPALLLPNLTTLQGLAATMPSTLEAVPDSRRMAMVYAALRERDWFAGADLWHVSAELLALFDDLTRHRVALPDSLEAFNENLRQAYAARSGNTMQFEARLVHELWYALQSSLDDQPDRLTHYHLGLARAAEQAAAPLYGIGLAQLSRAEEDFLAAWSQRQPVHLFRPVSEPAGQADARTALLEAAWATPPSPSLRERAETFRAAHAATPLGNSLKLFGANSLEEEARAVDVTLRQWLLQGKQHIAIVAQDRLVARRARALLERTGVLVEDETGWTFSTVAASTVVMRWLETVSGKFYYQALLDLLKSPFILSDWEAGRRKHAVAELEQLIRRHSVVSHLEHFQRLAQDEGGSADLRALLQRLRQAHNELGGAPRSLAGWLDALLHSLELLGVSQALRRDAAGEQLLALLTGLQAELEADTTQMSLAEWRQWLNRQLEKMAFRDESIASPVVLTQLSATRLRSFDAVLLLGCDAAHLPACGSEGVFFNQAVRAQLGLPTQEEALRQEREDLIGLLARCAEVCVTWQARKNAEPNLVSPYFERLETFHHIAYGASLRDGELADLLSWAQATPKLEDLPVTAPVRLSAAPRPALPTELVPRSLTASGYNSLMACPYQYFGRHALKLNEPDEVQLELEKKDYGTYVHRILRRFHQRHPSVSGESQTALIQELEYLTAQVFAEAIEANYLSHAWALRWRAAIPAYLEWQRRREAAGWRWHAGEVAKLRQIDLADGNTLQLKGVIDRIDLHGEQACSVLDYKTQRVEALKKKLHPAGEDVQLPVYALLLQQAVSEAAFVSIEQEGVTTVPYEEEMDAAATAALARLREIFDAIYRGAALPAQGTDEACGWCELRGLCRRDHWSEAS